MAPVIWTATKKITITCQVDSSMIAKDGERVKRTKGAPLSVLGTGRIQNQFLGETKV